MRISYFDLLLDREPGVPYLAGEEILGSIEIHVQEQTRIARLTARLSGQAHTGWRNKASDILFESTELIMDEYLDLTNDLSLHCTEGLEISEGKHKMEFKFKIPYDVLSSIEKENFGSIRYTCSAVLDIPEDGESEIISEKNLVIFSLLNLDAPHFRQSVRAQDQVNIIGCCCRRPKGWINAELIVSELGLLPGEHVKISLTIDNTVKKKKKNKKHNKAHECASLSLCQQLDFRAQSRYDPHVVDEKFLTIAVESEGTCKANEQKGPETKLISFHIPEGLPPTSTKDNGLITCSYFFKLDLEHFDVVVPVVIGSAKTMDAANT
uniref:Arrestin_C domain-containing protein n=1 Tax=Panagrellus redivivus TaxID=6233 RepID=A0A7E4UWR5_PANRE